MNKVVHFEIPAEDMKRAQDFYKKIFDWQINEMPEMNYTILQTGPIDNNNMPKESGFINGGMMEWKGKKDPVVTIAVESIDKTLKNISENGGEIIRDKMEVGDMGFAAYFKDCEGNTMGLWENKNPQT